MRNNRNHKRERISHGKTSKHHPGKLTAPAKAPCPQDTTPDPVGDDGSDNVTSQKSVVDAATPAVIVEATPSEQADNGISESVAEPGSTRDIALQETQIETNPAGHHMDVHPLAEIFPLPGEDDLRALAEDIKQNGQLEPITTFQGMILDGRCRNLACKLAGVEPKFEQYASADPVGFVLSKNVRRRHLTESQRAMVAAKLADMNVGANQYTEGVPIGRAAKLLNVSERSVARAKEVLRLGDSDLAKDVESGRRRVSVAAKKCRAPGCVQGPEAEQQGEADIKGRDQTLHSDHKPAAQVDEKATSESASSGGEDSSRTAVTTETMLAAAGPPITRDERGSNGDVGAAVDGGGAAADEAAFARLKRAWAAASDSARHRFIIEVAEPFAQSKAAA
jgi:hypothetical protein